MPAESRSCSQHLWRQLSPEHDIQDSQAGQGHWIFMQIPKDGSKIRISGWAGVACGAARGGSQTCKAEQWECYRMANVGI